jgi:acetyl esterase/lipase
MDIYQATTKKENSPIIVFIHGGSWDSGSKDIYKFFAEGFTSEGYDVAVPNYRLFPEIIYPDMLHDTAKAVAYLSNLFSKRKVVLIGHSAGGYNALMVAMNKDYLEEEGISVCSTISFRYFPLDLNIMMPHWLMLITQHPLCWSLMD